MKNNSAHLKLKFLIGLLAVFITACNPLDEKTPQRHSTRWRGLLHMNDSTQLPFIFTIDSTAAEVTLHLYNASDTVSMKRVTILGDSIYAEVPVFNAALSFVMIDPDHMRGAWHYYDKAEDFFVPISAIKTNLPRFTKPHQPCCTVEAPWAFTIGDKNSPHAVGDFRNQANGFSGSIITNSGDYRFMEGVVNDSTFQLATFDGAFAYYFKGAFDGQNKMSGTFYSSSTTVRNWHAEIDADFKLADADTMTYLKDPNEPFAFTFQTLAGTSKTYNNQSFLNKVTIVQILGTWCPNCLDETLFLKSLHKKYHSKGLEIVGLAFERNAALEYAKPAILKMQKDLGVPYPILFAGKAGALEAAAALPMLNAVLSYPTTIIVGADGKVRNIHTGFSGPSTSKYEDYVITTQLFIEELLNEIQ